MSERAAGTRRAFMPFGAAIGLAVRALTRSRPALVAAALAMLLGTTAGARPGQSLDAATGGGRVDLSGTWVVANDRQAPLQRPLPGNDDDAIAQLVASGVFERTRAQAADAAADGTLDKLRRLQSDALAQWRRTHNGRESLVLDPPDGRLPPLTPAAAARSARAWHTTWDFAGPWERPSQFSPDERCISRGMPGSMLPSADHGAIEIVQAPDVIAIRTEAIHEARIVPLAAAAVPVSMVSYMGRARGRWEGASLIVETSGFNGATGALDNGTAVVTSTEMAIRERFQLTAADRLAYELQVHDPATWTADWTVAFEFRRSPDYDLGEYACHEANAPFMRTTLAASRAAEKR